MPEEPNKLADKIGVYARESQVFIERFILNQADQRESRNRANLILQVKNEVTGRLNQSLHNLNPINLKKEEQPYQVKRPWDVEVKVGTQLNVLLQSDIDIIQIFNKPEISGKFLILGDPGSGKTTTLLELARELSSLAENDVNMPIPVLFNLSEWREYQNIRFLSPNLLSILFFWKKEYSPEQQFQDPTIAEWLIKELKEKYGVPTKVGKNWIEDRQILPMLDGLDELKSDRQEKCVLAINRFLTSEYRSSYLVICCRREEYENYKTRLHLNGAICLQTLMSTQIQDYLAQFAYQRLWQTIENDTDLFELAKSPLLLNVMALAYEEISIDEWQNFITSENRLQYLFYTYTERMLNRSLVGQQIRNNQISGEKFKYWLGWLAKILKQDAKTEFLVENMQPDWLKYNNQIWVYRFGIYLIFSTIIWHLIWSYSQPLISVFGEIPGNLFATVLGLISLFWVYTALTQEIKPQERLKISFQKLATSIPTGIIISVLLTLISWRMRVLGWEINPWRTLPGSLIIFLFVSAFQGANLDLEQRLVANQGIWKSLNNAMVLALAGILLANIISPQLRLLDNLQVGMYFGLIFGGTACIQHCILRLILWQSGFIPWNYAYFLDYATERLFLQRIGGRYRFIHDLLREYFANLQLERSEQSKQIDAISNQELNQVSIQSENRCRKLQTRLIIAAMVFITLFHIFTSFAFPIVSIPASTSVSMASTLQGNEVLIIDKLSFFFQAPKRGDIVALRSTASMKEIGFPSDYQFYRRIIGLPGEHFTFNDGKVYINEQQLEELHLVVPKAMDETVELSSDSYLLLGDNASYTGRESFTIASDKEFIIGRVAFCLYPFTKFGKIESSSLTRFYRSQVFEYDEVMSDHRRAIYAERRRALKALNLKRQVLRYAEKTVNDIVDAYISPDSPPKKWDVEQLVAKVKEYVYLLEEMQPSDLVDMNVIEIKTFLKQEVHKAYDIKEQQVEHVRPSVMREAERFFILQQIDTLWHEHVQSMYALQKSLGLKGYRQKGLLTNYEQEEDETFVKMMIDIRRNVVYSLFMFQPQ
jgi:signal peptidase I